MNKPTKTPKKKIKVISCFAPEAQAVYLAGSFNDWNPNSKPLKKAKNGKWSVRLSLPPGHHEYKFVVDGRWTCDPECSEDHICPNCVANDAGSMNRVLEIAPGS